MSIFGNVTTNFSITGTDIGNQFPLNNAVQKDYLIDVYPSLISTFKQSGLWLWGDNTYGQLGDNTRISKSSPIQTVASGTNWKQVSTGGQGHVGAIKTDGTLWMWGRNSRSLSELRGQLGDNTTVHKSSPVQTVSGGTNWRFVACGTYHTGAIKTDGTLWMWGYGAYGQLGNNASIDRSSPVQTSAGGTNWKRVAGGGGHTAAIRTDGTLVTFGWNAVGQLGDGTSGAGTWKSNPVQTVAGGTNWSQVAAGNRHTAAIKSNGTLWLWGINDNGQLGDNTVIRKSSPVQTVSGGTNWRFVACGSNHTTSIKTDGTLWLWGSNTVGELGDNSLIGKSSPVQSVAGGTNWKLVAAGNESITGTVTIKTDGTLWAWGYVGFSGDNTNNTYSSPVQTVSAGTNWKQVGTCQNTVYAIRDNSADIFGDPL